MSEWLKEHVWKSIPSTRVDAHQSPPAQFRSTTSPQHRCSSRCAPTCRRLTGHRRVPIVQEFERLGHDVRVDREHRTVSGVGIDDEVAIRKTPRQIVRVLAWNHAITIAVCDKHGIWHVASPHIVGASVTIEDECLHSALPQAASGTPATCRSSPFGSAKKAGPVP
jgi:hypothetical protein